MRSKQKSEQVGENAPYIESWGPVRSDFVLFFFLCFRPVNNFLKQNAKEH